MEPAKGPTDPILPRSPSNDDPMIVESIQRVPIPGQEQTRARTPVAFHQVPRKPAPKGGEFNLGPIVTMLTTLSIADPKPAAATSTRKDVSREKQREKRVSKGEILSPRNRRAHESPKPEQTSPRKEESEPIGHSVEKLLTGPSINWCKQHLSKLSPNQREEIKKRLVELKKHPEPAFPAPKQPATRERSRSLERIQTLFLGRPTSQEGATSPPKKERAIQPAPRERATSPRREQEQSPTRRQAISPRPERATSPSREEARPKIGPTSPRLVEREQDNRRPLSPPRTRVVEPVRLHKGELSDDEIRRVDELLKILEEIPVDERNRQLLQVIELHNRAKQGQEVTVWDHLKLSNESVISSEKLFKVIRDSLAVAGEKEVPPEQVEEREKEINRLSAYLNFSIEWLLANRQTEPYPKAHQYLAEISQIAEKHSATEVQELALSLRAKIDMPPEPSRRQSLERSISLSTSDFEKTLTEQITFGSLDKSYEAQAELVSFDLFLKLRQLVKDISPHDLIAKWETKLGKSLCVYTEFFNRFSEFIVDLLLRPGLKAQQRACIAKFFVHVAFKSAEIGDLTTPMIVCSALDHAAIDKLKIMWTLLQNDEFDAGFLRKMQPGIQEQTEPASAPSSLEKVSTFAALEILKKTFTPLRNYKAIRDLQTILQRSNSCFIPYLGMLQNIVTRIEEGNGKVAKDNIYNYEKLQMLYDNIHPALSAKDRPIPGKISHKVFQTDLFLQVFKSGDVEKQEPLFTYQVIIEESKREQKALECEKLDSASL